MDPRLVYVKTPIGDEAVRQSTHVVERKLRMVLVQLDGKLNVAEMAAKMGSLQLVERALHELEEGGFIVPSMDGVSVWEEGRLTGMGPASDISAFSTFGPRSDATSISPKTNSVIGKFSAFGKSILPTLRPVEREALPAKEEAEPVIDRGFGGRNILLMKWVATGLIVLAGLLLGVIFFYPLTRQIPVVESSLARYLQTPVRIKHLGMSLSPWPALVIRDVKVGDEGVATRISEIRVHSPASLLWSDSPKISKVEISGAEISANQFIALPFFNLASGETGRRFLVEKILFSESQVKVNDLALRDISGEITFGTDGVFKKGSFQAVDRSIQFAVTPVADGLALNIDGFGWKPAGKLISFDSLRATGLLQKNKLLIENLDTTVLGGVLRGTWLLDWSKGLVLVGNSTLSRLDCGKVSSAFAPALKLDGELGGVLTLRAGGRDWESMWASVEATLEAEIKRGTIHGVDLGSAARRGAGSVARAGSTKFERLRTTLLVNPHQISARDFQLEAGVMTASGQFVADRDLRVAGNLTVGFEATTSTPRIPVNISGVLPDLVTAGGK